MGRGTKGWGWGGCGRSEVPVLGGDEVIEGLVVLVLGLGGYCPAGDGGSARRGRRALRGVREVLSTTLGRGSPPEPLGGQADSRGHR